MDEPIDEARFEKYITRARDRQFVAAFVTALARTGGEISDSVLLEAAQQAWKPARHYVSREQKKKDLLDKARTTLGLSTVTAAIADFYGIEANFTAKDAVKLHVKHIKGIKFKQTIIDKEGNASDVWVTKPPSYEALRDFLKLTLPKEPKQINVDQRTLSMRMNVPYALPELDATPIGGVEGKP
jgi:hypothetical protein